jgi:hypothetical protein
MTLEKFLRQYAALGRCHFDVVAKDLDDGGIRLTINPQGTSEEQHVFLFRDQLMPKSGTFKKEANAAMQVLDACRDRDTKILALQKGIEDLWVEARSEHITKIG